MDPISFPVERPPNLVLRKPRPCIVGEFEKIKWGGHKCGLPSVTEVINGRIMSFGNTSPTVGRVVIIFGIEDYEGRSNPSELIDSNPDKPLEDGCPGIINRVHSASLVNVHAMPDNQNPLNVLTVEFLQAGDEVPEGIPYCMLVREAGQGVEAPRKK